MLNHDGPKSTAIECTTTALFSASMPLNFRATKMDTDQIEVRWEKPAETDGPLHGYRLFWDDGAGNEYNEVDLPSHRLDYTARFIESSTSYRFQVQAYTESGDGFHTSVLHTQTLQSAEERRQQVLDGPAPAGPASSHGGDGGDRGGSSISGQRQPSNVGHKATVLGSRPAAKGQGKKGFVVHRIEAKPLAGKQQGWISRLVRTREDACTCVRGLTLCTCMHATIRTMPPSRLARADMYTWSSRPCPPCACVRIHPPTATVAKADSARHVTTTHGEFTLVGSGCQGQIPQPFWRRGHRREARRGCGQ